jgi:hypothetical protein
VPEHTSPSLELLAVGVVELVAVAVPLEHLLPPVHLARERPVLQHARVVAEPHRAALPGDVLLLLHQMDHRVRRLRIDLRRVRAVEPDHVARELDHRHLHAEADAEERPLLLARVAHRRDLALGAAVAEAHRHEDRVGAGDALGQPVLLDLLGVDVDRLDLALVRDAAVRERFVQALVGVRQVDVLADHRDAHRRLRVLDGGDDAAPARQVRRAGERVQPLDDALVEAVLVEHERHLVDRADVGRADDAVLVDVAEERDLRLDLLVERLRRAAEQDVGLDAEARELLHGVLRGFVFSSLAT